MHSKQMQDSVLEFCIFIMESVSPFAESKFYMG